MDDLVSRILAPLVRHVLSAVFGYLVLKGWYSGEEGTALVNDIVIPVVGLLSTLAWSLYQKAQQTKLVKKALELPAGTPIPVVKAAAGVKSLTVLLAASALLMSGGCNKVPPNLDAYGAAAFRVEQVMDTVDLIGDMTVKAEKSGLVAHADTLLIADVAARVHEAGADLGRAFQAGDGAADAKAQAIAVIRGALKELPGNLSPSAQSLVQKYITLALSILDLIG